MFYLSAGSWIVLLLLTPLKMHLRAVITIVPTFANNNLCKILGVPNDVYPRTNDYLNLTQKMVSLKDKK